MEEKKLTWWRLMMKNPSYIIAFLGGLAFFIGLIKVKEESNPTAWWIGIILSVTIMVAVAYGGFYKFWFKDLNKGK